MRDKSTFIKKIAIAIFFTITLGIWVSLIWEHFHGGVPSHSLFARKDMPAISNWWGGILLPILTFFGLQRIAKRVGLDDESTILDSKTLTPIWVSFIAAFLYAFLMTYFYSNGNSSITSTMFQGLFLLCLLLPLYKTEFFLGFVIGLTFAFGVVLPTIIGSVIVAISFIAHRFVYPFVLKIFKQVK